MKNVFEFFVIVKYEFFIFEKNRKLLNEDIRNKDRQIILEIT